MTGAGHDGGAEPDVDVVVVGAGFAGLYALHRLRRSGWRTTVLEAGEDVGGTWYWNRYPGARCDVESVDYSYSFDEALEQDWVWSERYATQPEILAYLRHVADRFDLRRDVRLSTTVVRAAWDDGARRWSVGTDGGETLHPRFLVMATGCLSVPRLSTIAGSQTFEGPVLHTGRWPREGVDLEGRRVGVVGTGSSGTQLIPVAAGAARELTVFQRTPNFSVPANNAPLSAPELAEVKAHYPERRAFARRSATGLTRDMNRVSALAVEPEEREAVYEKAWDSAGFGFILCFQDLLHDPRANETAVHFLHGKVRALVDDPATARALTATDYPFGSKRPCVDTDFHATFNREHVRLVDVRADPIEEITPRGIRTREHEWDLDVIVLATGFDAMTGALERVEIVGREATLRQHWARGPRSYLGLLVSGFPNLFTVTGPGSPSVLSNVVVSIEQHVEWLDELLGHLRERGDEVVEAEPAAEAEWTEHVDDLAYQTLYPVGSSWYLGPERGDGRRSFMPYVGGLRAYRRACAEVAADGYRGLSLT